MTARVLASILCYLGPCQPSMASHVDEVSVLQAKLSLPKSAAKAAEHDQAEPPDSVKSSRSEPNMCLHGNTVPELFLLGAQKSGTTTLAFDLFSAKEIIGSYVRPEYGDKHHFWKEAHIFDNDTRWEQGLKFWYDHYPKCKTEQPIIAMDATPMLHKPWVPDRLIERYGSNAHRLKFVVLLRDPLHRMQSAFYDWKERAAGWNLPGWELKVFNSTFQKYVTNLLGRQEDYSNGLLYDEYVTHLLGRHSLSSVRYDQTLASSSYARQLSWYFKDFRASQFTIVPFQYLTRYSPYENRSVAWYITSKLGAQPPKSRRASDKAHNKRAHFALEDDLDPSSLVRIRSFLEKEAGATTVAKVLASTADHADLFHFSGQQNVVAIAKWLEENW